MICPRARSLRLGQAQASKANLFCCFAFII
jgi:hypothetical protein